jgi:hypothetical protein
VAAAADPEATVTTEKIMSADRISALALPYCVVIVVFGTAHHQIQQFDRKAGSHTVDSSGYAPTITPFAFNICFVFGRRPMGDAGVFCC